MHVSVSDLRQWQRRFNAGGSVMLLLLYTLVWAFAPLPLVMHHAPDTRGVNTVTSEQWLQHMQAQLLITDGHYLSGQPFAQQKDTATVSTQADDLSAQGSSAFPLAAPAPLRLDLVTPHTSDESAPLPSALDTSSKPGVPHLPPRG